MKSSHLKLRAYSIKADGNIIESSFALLKQAVKDIQTKNANNHSFEELYRTCYTLVLHKKAPRLYEVLKQIIQNDINERLIELLSITKNDKFVCSLLNYWKDNRLCLTMIRDVFMYLDRTYALPNKLDDILTMGIRAFKEQILLKSDVAEVLVLFLMELIDRERKGELTDIKTLKDTCNMLLEMDVKNSLVFIKVFENNFVEQTKLYLDKKSQSLIEEGDLVLFIDQLSRILKKEMSFVSNSFPQSTVKETIQIIEDVFTEDLLEGLIKLEKNGLGFLIEKRKFSEIKKLTLLFSHSESCVKLICEFLSQYMKKSTLNLILAPSPSNKPKDPLSFVGDLLDYKIMYDCLVSECFKKFSFGEKFFAKGLEELVNSNNRSALFLAQYIDININKHESSESEQISCEPLESCIYLFRLCRNKDIFEKHYRRLMMNRLLSSHVNRDMETHSISLLNSECGINFVQHMHTMLSDYSYSLEFETLLKRHLSTQNIELGISISVKIVDGRAWPVTETPQLAECVPDQIMTAFEQIGNFYSQNKKSRKLTLNPLFGSVELSSTFYNKIGDLVVPRTYLLEVSFYQMCILHLFNTMESICYKDIQCFLKIEEADLKSSLTSLFNGNPKSKILIKTPNSSPIEETDVFQINDQFNSKKYKVKVQTLISRSEKEKSLEKVDEDIEESRIWELEAAIVRIMKKRLKLNHQNLIIETVREVKSRFQPQPSLIKNAVDSLIRKEFLQLDPSERDVYIYVS